MAFVLETVLLLLFRLAYGRNMQDIEIVLLPLWNAEDNAEVVTRYIFFFPFSLSSRIDYRSNCSFSHRTNAIV